MLDDRHVAPLGGVARQVARAVVRLDLNDPANAQSAAVLADEAGTEESPGRFLDRPTQAGSERMRT